jgi:heavy metal sensor kinase
VVRITQLAAEIEEHDLSRRIELALPNDEIGSLARTFNAMLDRIERAFHRQRQFTADAAHELRTPLALMQSQLELALRAAHRSADDQRVLEELHADVERLTRIAAALLMLARGDAKWIELSQDDIDLGALVDLVAEHYRPLARQAGVDLTVAAEPVSLVGDDDRLVQVLVNLLDNALRHTPPGKRVTVGCRPDGAQAQLWVADEGAGIAPEHLPHLFERFYRVEAGRNRHQGGIGLGLSITKLLVEQHGGSITISSTPEKGTIVMITLPYQPRSPNQVECRAGH